MPIRTIIIDDHRLFSDGLSLILRESPDFEVVHQTFDSRRAFDDCQRHRPDLVLVDYNMPHLDGLAVVRQLKELPDPCRLVVISMYAEKREITRFKTLGIDGYLAKTIPAEELLDALRQIMTGQKVIEPTETPAPVVDDYFSIRQQLTPRETEILRCVGQDLTTEQIAERLSLSFYTVQTHRKNISRKLPFTSRKDLYDFLKTLPEWL
ncbi:response regulator [Persicitalea jodogahamensis]|uniref:DNA-binding response regulator n=1 Tax=Persicitalea jodogahamensis TaxID=402147 RepID=A0A8J3D651_9BACT|nr:response regulator transcription factor [Persicitalea jodogahamensis]GHB58173.1 DNA-binding response regulator [Persicitalea jodogahamensis]